MFSSDCLCVQSELVKETVGTLNANSSKQIKANDFKFDTYVSRDSLDTTP